MTNNPDKLQIYPRGFLGTPLPPTIARKETPFSNTYKQKQFSWSLLDTQDKKRFGDYNVEKLFSKYIRSEGNINSHAFRERIFKEAFKLFSGNHFYFWYQAQKASPLFGDYHQRFLEDTLQYLYTGKRELSVQAWDSLLSLSTETEDNVQDSRKVLEFFGDHVTGEGEKTPRNRSTVDVLQLWWSKPAGVGDLLYTLHILFGDI